MIFIAGGAGYMGQRLIRALLARGHQVTVKGNVLDGDSYGSHVAGHDTFVQMVGVPHPPASITLFT